MADSEAIEALLAEDRTFPPPASFAGRANVNDSSLQDAAAKDRLAFWEEQANALDWFQKWDSVLEWDLPFAKWFIGGKLNVSYNALDRHVNAGKGDKVAFHWEGEPGDTRTITYAEMLAEVEKFANVLKNLGVQRGDRINIYMPMIPELPVAMLACTRIGAAHSVVFGGFSSEALRDRINDAEAKVLITADGGYRRGAASGLKVNADVACKETPSIEHVVVVRRTGQDVEWTEGRDHWWHDLMDDPSLEATCEPEHMDSEDLLYLLYTSGTTAKPKGIMHTTGGYLTQVAFTHRYVFDLHAEDDIYWCAADIGWVTGHSYIVYAPLTNGATSVMYEGTPDFPDKDRWWSIIEKYRVTILYCAPTAIRTFMKWGTEYPDKHDLSTLRLLGSVGEPINPEAWVWYWNTIGGGNCPVVDTWWQTETGGIMISPLPGVTTLKPGSATFTLPGITAEVVDDGYLWLLGRVDDVMNVSGHRVSTTEVESALVDHPSVAEAAVVGANDATTGQAIIAFVTLKGSETASEAHGQALRDHVSVKIGPIAKPKTIVFTDDLPKTRSGKIMRRLLRDVAEGRALGDTTTLADASVVDEIARRAAATPTEE